MDYLIYILIGWGITDFLVNGSILDQIRVYSLVRLPIIAKLLTCIRCSGFWVGVLMGLSCLFDLASSPLWSFNPIAQTIASGFLISGSSVIINALIFSFFSRRIVNKNQSTDEEN